MKFPCGCDIRKFDPFDLPDCKATWKLISDGNTKGVFQVESYLGKHWSKRLKPDSLELLSAIIAIIRPGVLKAKDERGISMTEVFCRRRHGEEEFKEEKEIGGFLKTTYQVMVYQEQIMHIASYIAGFDLKEADQLRKAMGTKNAELMGKTRELFISKGIDKGLLTEEELNTLFDNIQKSNRYLFNCAHSMAYGQMGYITAYIKHHFPTIFYTSWIKYSGEEQDPKRELKELVVDARTNGIEILPPKLKYWRTDTHIRDGKIYLGLSNIKGVGEKGLEKTGQKLNIKMGKLGKTLEDLDWFDVLFLDVIPNKTLQSFIQAGVLSYLGKSRREMLAELAAWEQLTDKEKTGLYNNRGKDFVDTLKKNVGKKSEGGCNANEDRVDIMQSIIRSLERPASSQADTPLVISKFELDMLGVCLTAYKSDMINQNIVDTTCEEYLNKKKGILGVEIGTVKIIKVKNGASKGKEMCFFTGEDSTGSMEFVCFADKYEENAPFLIQGNLLIVEAYTRDRGAIVNRIWQA